MAVQLYQNAAAITYVKEGARELGVHGRRLVVRVPGPKSGRLMDGGMGDPQMIDADLSAQINVRPHSRPPCLPPSALPRFCRPTAWPGSASG
jgi:hypothetical protein